MSYDIHRLALMANYRVSTMHVHAIHRDLVIDAAGLVTTTTAILATQDVVIRLASNDDLAMPPDRPFLGYSIWHEWLNAPS
jgi:hypothetical protein